MVYENIDDLDEINIRRKEIIEIKVIIYSNKVRERIKEIEEDGNFVS